MEEQKLYGSQSMLKCGKGINFKVFALIEEIGRCVSMLDVFLLELSTDANVYTKNVQKSSTNIKIELEMVENP